MIGLLLSIPKKWTIELTLPVPSAPKFHPHAHQHTTSDKEAHPSRVPLKFEDSDSDLEAYTRLKRLEGKGKAREVSFDPMVHHNDVSTRDSSTPITTDSYLKSATSTRDTSSAFVSSAITEPSTSASSPPIQMKLKARSISPPITLTAPQDEGEDPVNPLGPTAKYPFLPVRSDDCKIVIRYSCRIGGPKIYDLLGTLPMDQFGVLAWVVLDREEEIFEVDDIKDEYKVMHALWARWIFLNR